MQPGTKQFRLVCRVEESEHDRTLVTFKNSTTEPLEENYTKTPSPVSVHRSGTVRVVHSSHPRFTSSS